MSHTNNMDFYNTTDIKLILGTMFSGTIITYGTPENITFMLDALSHIAQIACYSVGTYAAIRTIIKSRKTKK